MRERERREGDGGGRKSVIRSTTAGGACDVYSVNTRQQVRALHSPLVYTLSLEVGLEGGLHSRSSDIPPCSSPSISRRAKDRSRSSTWRDPMEEWWRASHRVVSPFHSASRSRAAERQICQGLKAIIFLLTSYIRELCITCLV